jgi:uncharacterized Zn-binding protein involved in type VI secretion
MFAASHFDKVRGIDIHITLIPNPSGVPVPTPLPYPFLGIVLDIFDYAPHFGAKVFVNGLPRAQAGTAVKGLPHLPQGGLFANPPSNGGEVFMGSKTVIVENEPFAYTFLPVLTCNDFGMPPVPRMKIKGGNFSLGLPTSILLSVPNGFPVWVGGLPTVSKMTMFMKVLKMGGGKAFDKLGGGKMFEKLAQKLAKEIAEKLTKEMIKKSGILIPKDVAKKIAEELAQEVAKIIKKGGAEIAEKLSTVTDLAKTAIEKEISNQLHDFNEKNKVVKLY